MILKNLFKKKSANELIDKAYNLITPKKRSAYIDLDLGIGKKALKLTDKALKIEPNSLYGLYTKGVILLSLDNFKESRTCFNKCIKINKEMTSRDLIITGDFHYDISNQLLAECNFFYLEKWLKRTIFCYKLSLKHLPKNIALVKKVKHIEKVILDVKKKKQKY